MNSESLPIRLIATDLDGTLLTDDKELTPATLEVLREANRRGAEILVSTGRPLTAVPKALMELDMLRYYMVSDGAAIYDKKQDAIIHHACMTNEQITKIWDRLFPVDAWKEVCVNGTSHVERERYEHAEETIPNPRHKDYLLNTRKPEDDMRAFLASQTDGIEKLCVFFTRKELYGELRELLSDIEDLYVTSAMWYNIEVSNFAAEKGIALRHMAELLGIDISQTIAFGDNLNDAGMIRAAGIGVAMANAEESVKEAADYVTLTNNEEGVAAAIRKFVLRDTE